MKTDRGAPDPEREDRDAGERRVLSNLLAAIVMLLLAIAAFWLLTFLDEKRKLESCLEAGRRNCGDVSGGPAVP